MSCAEKKEIYNDIKGMGLDMTKTKKVEMLPKDKNGFYHVSVYRYGDLITFNFKEFKDAEEFSYLAEKGLGLYVK